MTQPTTKQLFKLMRKQSNPKVKAHIRGNLIDRINKGDHSSNYVDKGCSGSCVCGHNCQ